MAVYDEKKQKERLRKIREKDKTFVTVDYSNIIKLEDFK